jgi:Asp/Glu/hydantoin racemase
VRPDGLYGEARLVRIVYVLPGPMGRSEAGRSEMERRLSILRSYAAPGTEVDIADVDEGPASIESLYEEYLSIPKTVERMLEAEKEGYDAAVRAIETPVLALAEDKVGTTQKLVEEGRRAIVEDRADTLVLGCMSMGFLGVAEEMSEVLGVPVVNPGRTSLKMAEALVGAGLVHSKLAYMTPPKIASGEVESSADLMVKKDSRHSEAYPR